MTPTTKAADHDEPIAPRDIVARGLMSQAHWDQVRCRHTRHKAVHAAAFLDACAGHGLAALKSVGHPYMQSATPLELALDLRLLSSGGSQAEFRLSSANRELPEFWRSVTRMTASNCLDVSAALLADFHNVASKAAQYGLLPVESNGQSRHVWRPGE